MATPNNGQGMPSAAPANPTAAVATQQQQLLALMRTNPAAYNQLVQQQLWHEFFQHRPDLRPMATNQDPEVQARLRATFSDWAKARPVQAVAPVSAAPAAPSAGPTVSGAASGGSVGAAAGRIARQASGVSPDALAGASAAATSALAARAAAEREASLKKLQAALSFLSRPATPDDKSFLPRKRLATLFQKACGGGGKLAPEAEAGVRALAEDFSRGALAFAVAAARRRRSATLDPADVALYVKQTYDVELPGFGRAEVAPYRRLAGSEAHKARLAAVRRANVAMTRQAAAAAGKTKEGGAAATPAKSKKGGAKAAAAARVAAAAQAAAAAEDDDGMELEDALEEELGGGAGGAEAEEEDMPDI